MNDRQYTVQWIGSDLWPVLVGAVYDGYRAVNALDLSYFTKTSSDIRALAYHCGVQAALARYVAAGVLPGNAQFYPNAAGSSYHVEWHYNGAILTANQVHTYEALPRRAEFRKELGLHNIGRGRVLQPDFFDHVRHALSDHCYFLLTHGYQKDIPSFVGLGVPRETLDGWYYSINLLQLVKPDEIVSLSEVPTEEITGEVDVQLRAFEEFGGGEMH